MNKTIFLSLSLHIWECTSFVGDNFVFWSVVYSSGFVYGLLLSNINKQLIADENKISLHILYLK